MTLKIKQPKAGGLFESFLNVVTESKNTYLRRCGMKCSYKNREYADACLPEDYTDYVYCSYSGSNSIMANGRNYSGGNLIYIAWRRIKVRWAYPANDT